MYLADLSKAKVTKSLHGLLALSLVLLYLNPYLHRYGQVAMLGDWAGGYLFPRNALPEKGLFNRFGGENQLTTLLADQDPSKSWQLRTVKVSLKGKLFQRLKRGGKGQSMGV